MSVSIFSKIISLGFYSKSHFRRNLWLDVPNVAHIHSIHFSNMEQARCNVVNVEVVESSKRREVKRKIVQSAMAQEKWIVLDVVEVEDYKTLLDIELLILCNSCQIFKESKKWLLY